VRPEGLELSTFWFVARRSIQLSYGRTVILRLLQIVYSILARLFNFDFAPQISLFLTIYHASNVAAGNPAPLKSVQSGFPAEP
jgi:hypothetical protein